MQRARSIDIKGAGRNDWAERWKVDSMNTKHTNEPSTDQALWETRRAFGVAGGPDEIVLSSKGEDLAFSVGSGTRLGGPSEALEDLWLCHGPGYLSVRVPGSARLKRTDLGRFNQNVWGRLREQGLVRSFQDNDGDGVVLTDKGVIACERGIEERKYLLDRCRRAALAKVKP